MSAPLLATASLQLTLPLTWVLAIAVTAVIAVPYIAKRHAQHLAGRLRRLTTNPPTSADDAASAGEAREDGAAGSPPSPTAAPTDPPPTQPSTPQLAGARYAPDTFELVAQHVDHTQRLAFAEARLEKALSTLPSDRWVIQRFALVAGDRIPFLVLGEFGIFALWAVTWRPQWTDPAFVSQIAANVKNRLPEYPGPVIAGLCGVLEPGMQPRFWYRSGTGGGAWILGVDWLLRWMEHFGHQHGLGIDDIQHFRTLAKPDWSRPPAPVPPGIPIIDAGIGNAE